MRHSSKKTTVAVLRSELGLPIEKFADLIGKKTPTIRSLESGRLKLSEETALRIDRETGLSARWLLEGDPDKPMHSAEEFGGGSYSKQKFEEIQAGKNAAKETRFEVILPKTTPARLHVNAVMSCLRWFPILSAAKRSGKQEVAFYLLGMFFDEMEERFGFDFKTPEKINRKAKLTAANDDRYTFVFEDGDCSLEQTKGKTGIKIRRRQKEDSEN